MRKDLLDLSLGQVLVRETWQVCPLLGFGCAPGPDETIHVFSYSVLVALVSWCHQFHFADEKAELQRWVENHPKIPCCQVVMLVLGVALALHHYVTDFSTANHSLSFGAEKCFILAFYCGLG